MPLNVRRFKSEFDVNVVLNGGIQLPLPLRGSERFFGLHALTLVFTTPEATVTFDDPTGAGLLVKDIIDQINTDANALKAFLRNQVLYIMEVSPSGGIVLDGANSTARPVLKLPNGNVTGIIYDSPDGTAPRLISLADTGVMDGFVLVTEEA